MRENIGGPAVSLLGTLLAALTSWLSFGLLLVSQTPVIANFGLAVSLGLFFCFLLAPWASPATRRGTAQNTNQTAIGRDQLSRPMANPSTDGCPPRAMPRLDKDCQ
jgi:hypothetical protein